MIDIESLRSLAEPLKSYNFEIYIPVVPGGADLQGEDIRFYCRTGIIPGETQEPIVVDSGGHQVMFAGRTTYSHQFPVSMRLHEDLKVINMLRTWRDLLFNKQTGAQSVASEYKAQTLYAILLDSAKNPVQYYRAVGAWPSVVPDVPLGYGGNEALELQVVFTFDYWIFK